MKEFLQPCIDAKSAVHKHYLGQAMPDAVYQLFVLVRDGVIPALAQQDPSDSEYARGFGDGQKEFSEIAGGAWQIAVIDQLVIHHIYQSVHDTDPRKAVNDLLCISNDIALDPRVSSDAQALIDRGRREAQQEQPAQEPVAWRWRWKTDGSALERRFADPDTYMWGYRNEPLPEESATRMEIESLYTHPAPTQRALRDDDITEIAKPFISSMGDHWCHEDGIRDNGAIEEFARAVIEAHCRGGQA